MHPDRLDRADVHTTWRHTMRTRFTRGILIAFLSIVSIVGMTGEASAMIKSDPNTCNDEVMICKDVEPWFYFV
jgi:hypothetical protein